MARAISQFLIEWTERGGQLPEKVKRELDRLNASGTAAGQSLSSQLGAAFERLDKRAPIQAVRALDSAVERLTATALGSAGPVGRLAASFQNLIPGGVKGLAAVGGVSLIVLEIQKLIGLSDALEQRLLKVNQAFASMAGGSAAAFARLGEMRAEVERLAEPGLLERLANAPGLRLLFGDIGTNLQQGRLATQSTLLDQIGLQTKQIDEAQARLIEGKAKETAADLLRLTHLREEARELVKRGTAQEQLRQLGLQERDLRVTLLQVTGSTAEHDEVRNRLHRELLQLMERERVLGTAIAGQAAGQAAAVARGLAGFAPQPAISTTEILLRQGGRRGGAVRPIASPFDVSTEAGRLQAGERLDEEARQRQALFAGQGSQLQPAQIITALSALIGGARGGPGGLFSALSGVAGLLPGPGSIIGAGLGLFGQIFSLFDRSEERRHREQLEALRDLKPVREATRIQVNVVSPSTGEIVKSTIYQAGRSQERDAVDRVPDLALGAA